MVGLIFMLGAEFNAAILKYKVYSVVKQFTQQRTSGARALHRRDKGAQVGQHQFRLFQRGEMPAPRHLGPMYDIVSLLR